MSIIQHGLYLFLDQHSHEREFLIYFLGEEALKGQSTLGLMKVMRWPCF